jgi:hypothetical protein
MDIVPRHVATSRHFAADAECQRVGTRLRIAETDELVPLAEKLLRAGLELTVRGSGLPTFRLAYRAKVPD